MYVTLLDQTYFGHKKKIEKKHALISNKSTLSSQIIALTITKYGIWHSFIGDYPI